MAIPKGLSFDELNALYKEEHGDNLRSMPFEEFFGEMDISEEQTEKRIETAKDIRDFMLLALMAMYLEYTEGTFGYMDVAAEISRNYKAMLERMGIPLTDYFSASHADSIATEIAVATMNHPDDSYFYSEDRAMLIAENEAESIWNDSEYEDAILTGKTRKTWNAIMDKRTRDTHREINGKTIPIDEYFYVGESLMFYPHDPNGAPEEVVNCRCWATYS